MHAGLQKYKKEDETKIDLNNLLQTYHTSNSCNSELIQSYFGSNANHLETSSTRDLHLVILNHEAVFQKPNSINKIDRLKKKIKKHTRKEVGGSERDNSEAHMTRMKVDPNLNPRENFKIGIKTHQHKKISDSIKSFMEKKQCMQIWILSLILFFAHSIIHAQDADSTKNMQKRKWLIGSGTALTAGTSYYLLNDLWYKNYERSSFHFFNDNNEWLQMDKVGHTFSTYTTGRYMCDVMRWSGVKENTSVWLGGTAGLIYLTGIEIMDGKSSAWGFSTGDMIANATGSFLFIAQEKIFKEQRIKLKFSYSDSDFAMLNSDQLGRNFQQRLLKDYNAQTYWASINVHSFLASDADFPRWINIAFGYGATKMISAEMNDFSVNNFQREREFYLSFDADLERVRWKKKWMKTTAKVLSFIKIPTPTFEMRSGGQTKFHWLFF